MGYANAYPNTAVNSFRTYLNESQNGQITEKTFTWVWWVRFIEGDRAPKFMTENPIKDKD